MVSIDPNGPDRPLASLSSAPAQLHETGHSSIVQHFRRVKVGTVDRRAVGSSW
jgi:hypothetical protein